MYVAPVSMTTVAITAALVARFWDLSILTAGLEKIIDNLAPLWCSLKTLYMLQLILRQCAEHVSPAMILPR